MSEFLPQVMPVFEKFGAVTQGLSSSAFSAALPVRKILGWEYSRKHSLPCTVELAPLGKSQRVVVRCDVSLVRGRRRPLGYFFSAMFLVIGAGIAIAGRGVSTDVLAIFLMVLFGWVILQLTLFLDYFRIRVKVLQLIRSVR
ncbi:MAG: hypothetical protein A3I14_13665 [Candidatus Rokubacteria bacterium RIFCSPLOWO2_02_FULL_73_56]|nr:MAG: hypothetical protein A3I14_13665 [Candidatus Rokubacteria bacterium RIFCSPLOWO2_02_FULL_73_56]OGL21641.1 MAG: hypothetical protein A3G44_04235 [Candidatus Rokubacteria bacterium RIFCSPLOWO2_12_FULL_73_47]